MDERIFAFNIVFQLVTYRFKLSGAELPGVANDHVLDRRWRR